MSSSRCSQSTENTGSHLILVGDAVLAESPPSAHTNPDAPAVRYQCGRAMKTSWPNGSNPAMPA
jgi:hypothetical protein